MEGESDRLPSEASRSSAPITQFTGNRIYEVRSLKSELRYSGRAGVFDAINSANRLSLRNSANSASLYTFLKSL